MLKHLAEADAGGFTFFMAKVVENNDPDRKQRIKVRIPQLLDSDIAIEDLPWLLPVSQAPFVGSSGTYGSVAVPPIDSVVIVIFQDNNIQYGLYLGTTQLQATALDVLLTNYPKRRGFVDPAGNHAFVDITEGDTKMELKHNSGTIITVNDDGSIVITGVDDAAITVQGNVTLTVNGNVTASVGGDLSATVTGDITSSAAGWNHTGDITVAGDVVANGISLTSHVHGGVTTGGGTTQGPQ